MRFLRYGDSYQLYIKTGEDLDAVLRLDESLWAATSAPRDAFRCDPRFLSFVDSDGDGRIKSWEIKEAIRWLGERLGDRSCMADRIAVLPLSAIDSGTAGGKSLLSLAAFILERLMEKDRDSISLAQVRRFTAEASQQPLNGDGSSCLRRPGMRRRPRSSGT